MNDANETPAGMQTAHDDILVNALRAEGMDL